MGDLHRIARIGKREVAGSPPRSGSSCRWGPLLDQLSRRNYTRVASGCSADGSAPRLGRGGRRFKSAHPDTARCSFAWANTEGVVRLDRPFDGGVESPTKRAWPSGKASAFQADIRRFESGRPLNSTKPAWQQASDLPDAGRSFSYAHPKGNCCRNSAGAGPWPGHSAEGGTLHLVGAGSPPLILERRS